VNRFQVLRVHSFHHNFTITRELVPLTFPYRSVSETVLPKAGRPAGVQSQRLVESAMLVLLVLPLLRVSMKTNTNQQTQVRITVLYLLADQELQPLQAPIPSK
jgi:hypothetical protein